MQIRGLRQRRFGRPLRLGELPPQPLRGLLGQARPLVGARGAAAAPATAAAGCGESLGALAALLRGGPTPPRPPTLHCMTLLHLFLLLLLLLPLLVVLLLLLILLHLLLILLRLLRRLLRLRLRLRLLLLLLLFYYNYYYHYYDAYDYYYDRDD